MARAFPDGRMARRVAARLFREGVEERVARRVVLAELTGVQRQYAEDAARMRREGLSFGEGFRWNSDGRAILPVSARVRQLAAPEELRSALERLGYEISDYREGKAVKTIDVRDGKKTVTKNIGKILEHEIRDEELSKAFKQRLRTAPKRTGEYQVVVTHNPADVAGMSTGRNWVSCMTLPGGDELPGADAGSNRTRTLGGQYYTTALRQVQYGGMCAYLVEKGDTAVERPLARIALKRLENGAGDFIYEAESRVYGDEELADECGFREVVEKALEEANRVTSGGRGGLYRSTDENSYSDLGDHDIYRKPVVNSDEDALSLPPEEFLRWAKKAPATEAGRLRRLFVKYALALPSSQRGQFVGKFLAAAPCRIGEEEVEALSEWIDWSWVSLNVVMSEDFLRRHASQVDWQIVSLDGLHYPPEMLEQFRKDPELRRQIDEYGDLPEGDDLQMAIRDWMADFATDFPFTTYSMDGDPDDIASDHTNDEVQDECYVLEEGDSFTTGMHFRVEVRMPLLMDADFEDAPAIQAQVRQYEYGAAKDFIEEWNLGMTVQDFLDDYLPGLDDDDDMSAEWLQFLDGWNASKTVDFICDVTLVVQPSGLPGVCEIRAASRLEADGDAEDVLRTDAVCSSKEQFLGRGKKAVLDALNALGGFVYHQ